MVKLKDALKLNVSQIRAPGVNQPTAVFESGNRNASMNLFDRKCFHLRAVCMLGGENLA